MMTVPAGTGAVLAQAPCIELRQLVRAKARQDSCSKLRSSASGLHAAMGAHAHRWLSKTEPVGLMTPLMWILDDEIAAALHI